MRDSVGVSAAVEADLWYGNDWGIFHMLGGARRVYLAASFLARDFRIRDWAGFAGGEYTHRQHYVGCVNNTMWISEHAKALAIRVIPREHGRTPRPHIG